MNRETKLGLIGASALSGAMLLFAIYGKPPYAYFGWLKIVTCSTCVLSAWFGVKQWRWFIPIALCLVSMAYIHGFWKMRREEWSLFNWLCIGTLALSSIAILMAKEKTETT